MQSNLNLVNEGDIIHCITRGTMKGEYMITSIHKQQNECFIYAYSVTSSDGIILRYHNNKLMDEEGLLWEKLYQDKNASSK